MKPSSKSPEVLRFSPVLLTLIFFSLSFYLVLNHAMWRDELQAWLIAKDSQTILELILNTRYEGHPTLWYLLIMVANQIWPNPVSMQILHVIFASITVFIFLKYSPFTRSQKVLFIFGYYPFYEYSVVSRSYGIGVLLIFLFCALFKNRKKHIFAISLTLFLLAQTNIFGLIVSAAALSSLIIESVMAHKGDKNFQGSWQIYSWFGLALLGMLASAWEMSPPIDSGFAKDWFFLLDRSRFQGALSAFSNAFFPIPAFQQNYWNTSNWSGAFSAYLFAPLAIGACLLLAKNIRSNIPALCFFIFSLMGIELFLYLKYLGYWRHQGYLYIVFIAAIWLSRDCSVRQNELSNTQPSNALNIVINSLLVIQLIGSIVAQVGEQRFVFSSGRELARYLESNHLLDRPFVAFPDYVAPSVLGYLGDKKIFYPQANSEGTFIRWDTKRLRPLDISGALLSARQLNKDSANEAIFITNTRLDDALIQKEDLTFQKSFEGAINRDENFYLYSFKKVN